jgi:hypothetical protein
MKCNCPNHDCTQKVTVKAVLLTGEEDKLVCDVCLAEIPEEVVDIVESFKGDSSNE